MNIPIAILQRVNPWPYKRGQPGWLTIDGQGFATLEPNWNYNRKNDSCVYAGRYVCKLRESPRFGLRYHLEDVPDRSHILIHAGNYGKDTKGCILLAESFDADAFMIKNSRKALDKFEGILKGEAFMLSIRNVGYHKEPSEARSIE